MKDRANGKATSVDEVVVRLQLILSDVFGLSGLTVSETTTAADVEGWDSLGSINLIFAVESAFGIRFALGELQDLDNVGELARSIARKREQAVGAD